MRLQPGVTQPGGVVPFGAAPRVLQALGLSYNRIEENSPPGTGIGALSGVTAGSTLSLANSASNRVALSGNTLVAGSTNSDYEQTTSYTVVVRETLAGAVGSPRDTSFTIYVDDVFEADVIPDAISFQNLNFDIPSPATYGGTQGTNKYVTGINTPIVLRFQISSVSENANAGAFYVQSPSNTTLGSRSYATVGNGSFDLTFSNGEGFFFYWDIATAGAGTQSASFTVNVLNMSNGGQSIGAFTCSGIVRA